MLLVLSISYAPREIQRTGMEKHQRGRWQVWVQNTNLLFCTLNMMMKIWWNLCIWFLNRFMMQVQGNMYRGDKNKNTPLPPATNSNYNELTSRAKFEGTHSGSVF